MDVGLRIKKYREKQNMSQDELALKIFVSRQTISNWETSKSYPDIKSLIMLSNIFNASLDDFIKGDIEEMRKRISKEEIRRFHAMGNLYFAELLILGISAYPLFKVGGYIGAIVWIAFFIVAFITAYKIEKFKKNNDIQTYKEIVAFVDGEPLTYEETQQELGKRRYQKIFAAFLVGVITFILCMIMAFIMEKI